MIPQNQEKWSTVVRDRQWAATIFGVGQPVIVANNAILAPGEDLTEDPETWELTWGEWESLHESSYGLTIDGFPVAEAAENKAAWRRLRRAANGEIPIDQDFARSVLRILRSIAREVL